MMVEEDEEGSGYEDGVEGEYEGEEEEEEEIPPSSKSNMLSPRQRNQQDWQSLSPCSTPSPCSLTRPLRTPTARSRWKGPKASPPEEIPTPLALALKLPRLAPQRSPSKEERKAAELPDRLLPNSPETMKPGSPRLWTDFDGLEEAYRPWHYRELGLEPEASKLKSNFSMSFPRSPRDDDESDLWVRSEAFAARTAQLLGAVARHKVHKGLIPNTARGGRRFVAVGGPSARAKALLARQGQGGVQSRGIPTPRTARLSVIKSSKDSLDQAQESFRVALLADEEVAKQRRAVRLRKRQEAAATKIQAGVRGLRDRKRVRALLEHRRLAPHEEEERLWREMRKPRSVRLVSALERNLLDFRAAAPTSDEAIQAAERDAQNLLDANALCVAIGIEGVDEERLMILDDAGHLMLEFQEAIENAIAHESGRDVIVDDVRMQVPWASIGAMEVLVVPPEDVELLKLQDRLGPFQKLEMAIVEHLQRVAEIDSCIFGELSAEVFFIKPVVVPGVVRPASRARGREQNEARATLHNIMSIVGPAAARRPNMDNSDAMSQVGSTYSEEGMSTVGFGSEFEVDEHPEEGKGKNNQAGSGEHSHDHSSNNDNHHGLHDHGHGSHGSHSHSHSHSRPQSGEPQPWDVNSRSLPMAPGGRSTRGASTSASSRGRSPSQGPRSARDFPAGEEEEDGGSGGGSEAGRVASDLAFEVAGVELGEIESTLPSHIAPEPELSIEEAPIPSFDSEASLSLRELFFELKSTNWSEREATPHSEVAHYIKQLYIDNCTVYQVKPNSLALARLDVAKISTSPDGAIELSYDFSSCHLGDRGAICMLHALAHDNHLSSVSFASCGLRRSSALCFGVFLEMHPRLKDLDLQQNSLSYESGESFLQSLRRRLQSSRESSIQNPPPFIKRSTTVATAAMARTVSMKQAAAAANLPRGGLHINLGGTPLAWDRHGSTVGPPAGSLWAGKNSKSARLAPSGYEKLREALDETQRVTYARSDSRSPSPSNSNSPKSQTRSGGQRRQRSP